MKANLCDFCGLGKDRALSGEAVIVFTSVDGANSQTTTGPKFSYGLFRITPRRFVKIMEGVKITLFYPLKADRNYLP